jgi:hypothetical protein
MQSTREREGAAERGLAKVFGPLIAVGTSLGLWIVIHDFQVGTAVAEGQNAVADL